MRDWEIMQSLFYKWWQREHSIIDVSTTEGHLKVHCSEDGFRAGFFACLDEMEKRFPSLFKTDENVSKQQNYTGVKQ